MLDIFVSLGVNALDVTWTDIDGRKHGFRGYQTVERLRRWMPYLIQSSVERQHNVIVRPRGATIELVQLNDLSQAGLERLKTTAFLILTTSPEN
jgi:hypothetical protein